MKTLVQICAVFSFLILVAGSSVSQTFPTDDPVIKNFWKEAVDSSQLESLAHQLFDVIGPRLVGSPQMKQANDWAVATYKSWGIEAKNEQWGKWKGWERGTTHIDLLQPRVRTLEGTMEAWCPPTKKGGLTAGIVILPDVPDSIAFLKWLREAKGKFVLIAQPQLTGRPDKDWEEFATPKSFDTLKAARKRLADQWNERIRKTGFKADTLPEVLEAAGAAGAIQSRWTGGWGTYRVFGTKTMTMPVVNLGVEDYNLLYRLVEYGDKPLIRVATESKFLGEVPTFNTIGTIPGTEKPNEFVMLSAHFDSWDASSGSTDNGTGTLVMMETMRLLKKYYPHPKRTIIIADWGSEEQGLNGSQAFVQDHPDIVNNLQALFNQDNGTGRVVSISAQGFIDAGQSLAKWISRVPTEVTENIKLTFPGMPFGGGTDNASFVTAGAPGFGLGSNQWDYFLYTWHTNRDTYDKLVFDDLKNNVVLTACLAYLASEDSTTVSRVRRVMPIDEKTGQPRIWPQMHGPERAGGIKK
ncbi:MAG TPA: M28 family peptidase [Bacteroidota bacterium]